MFGKLPILLMKEEDLKERKLPFQMSNAHILLIEPSPFAFLLSANRPIVLILTKLSLLLNEEIKHRECLNG